MPDAGILRAVVADKRAETRDICAIGLRGNIGSPLPSFQAGAHIDVHLPGGFVRQYSLCNAPTDRDRYVLGVLHNPSSRGGSRAVHESVKPGDTLAISAPKNHFPLVAEAAHSILIAAGIGITPILSMAEHLCAIGASFDLHYSARSRDTAAFLKYMEASPFASKIRLHLSGGLNESRMNVRALLATPRSGWHLYVCGPRGFMDVVLGAARLAGWPAAQLHQEHFSAGTAQPAAGGCFEVMLARDGRIVQVGANESVVRALAAAGVSIATSCEQGVCGTCLTRVLEGEPEHHDLFLSPEEQARNDQFLPCCSRSRTARLTIDL